MNKHKLASAVALSVSVLLAGAGADAQELPREIEVVGTTPGAGLGMPLGKIPYAVRSADAPRLEQAQSLDLTDYLNSKVGSVNINSAQNNPLQPDLQFRGFTASPLLGLPQGVAVYQNGVRVNEPLGDAVNWDLLPESAVHTMDLISGADPLFGLNTLGGALSLTMKNGFNFAGHQAEVQGGSWGRRLFTLESGGNDGTWGYYLNASGFEEDGWRDLSASEALNVYGSLSWRDEDLSALNLNLQHGDSELRGNGAAPVGLLGLRREAIFTAPDITENDMTMVSVDGSHFLTSSIQLAGSAFWRDNETDSFNGDGSEFETCEYAGGALSLFEEADDIEDALEDQLGIELDDICEGGDPAITSFADLEDYIEARAAQAGLDPELFEIEDVTGELSGAGAISDEAINNISRRVQESRGFDTKATFLGDLFGRDNRMTAGVSWFAGQSTFDSVVELARLDPVTRSTAGLGTGVFFDEGETRVNTETETWSLYFTDTIDIGERLALTFGGRFNSSDITLRDRSGERPELNGDHEFERFNPMLGLTYDVHSDMNVYGSYSESNRVPTPIELACNEGVFDLAREYAIAAGEDPDDVEYECRLPNAFLADPPLNDVVTRSVELGMRGVSEGMRYHLGLFHASNRDDILFQTTGRYSGLFANVDETRRVGFEGSLGGTVESLDWYASYTWVRATFEDDFRALSPNHPAADEEGNIDVARGDRLPGIPENLFKLGGDWRFPFGLSVGAEAVYNSSQYLRGDESNELAGIDGYTVVNLRASYTWQDSLTVFARVNNVFDEEFENFGLLGEDPSEVLELSDSRPLFLGAGAPRAGWVGLRLSF